jgi:hypothetical protein
MLKNEIEKKKSIKKIIKTNQPNSWPELWDHDNPHKNKLK